MRSPTRASELVTDVQEASLPPVREEDRHRPRGAAGRSRPEVLTADIRASAGAHPVLGLARLIGGSRCWTLSLVALSLRRRFPSFTSSYVFGGAVMIRRSISSNSSMVTDEASPEGRSASVPSSAGSFCPMFRRSIRAGASMPQSITRGSVRAQRLAEVQVLTLSADAGWYAARRRTDAEDREGRRLRSRCGGTPRRGAV